MNQLQGQVRPADDVEKSVVAVANSLARVIEPRSIPSSLNGNRIVRCASCDKPGRPGRMAWPAMTAGSIGVRLGSRRCMSNLNDCRLKLRVASPILHAG
jgi:hypothetical protein